VSSATASTGAGCSSPETAVILTCEHGGSRVPRAWASLFDGCSGLLESHRGWDPGALELARALSSALNAPLFYSTNSRLLVDLNRSLHHPRLFSAQTRRLGPAEKELLIEKYYLPFHRAVDNAVRSALKSNQRVLHLSVHSFTPVLDGIVRTADLGLLYDPRRGPEKEVSLRLKQALAGIMPGLRLRFNYPYRGVSDGHTTHLRRLFPAEAYSGIEIEVNQKFPLGDCKAWNEMNNGLVRALERISF
jgi:predicted N-formylglutamate amidohydrolase